jgi:putative glutamine amidotransferase
MVRRIVNENNINQYEPRVAIVEDANNPATQRIVDLIEKAGGKPMIIPRELSDRLLASQDLDPSSIARIRTAKSLDEVREFESAINAATKLHLQYIARKLTYVDAVVLPGNEYDIPAEAFHDTQVHEAARIAPPFDVRFQTESLMAEYAMHTRKIPILGISHGMQLLVVKTGGRLHQNVPNVETAIAEPANGNTKGAVVFRRVDSVCMVNSQSILGAILQGKKAEIFLKDFNGDALGMSDTRQQAVSVNDVNSRELSITATSDNQLVEAVEHKHHPFCLGIQFHPEYDVKFNLGFEIIHNLVDFARSIKLPLKQTGVLAANDLPSFVDWYGQNATNRSYAQ